MENRADVGRQHFNFLMASTRQSGRVVFITVTVTLCSHRIRNNAKSALVLLVQLANLLLHIFALLAWVRHASESGLTGHTTDAIIRTDFGSLSPCGLFFVHSVARAIEDVCALAGKSLQVVRDFLR